ncbi:nucleoside hydrolase [Runella sp.]|uniref:nucleoside hydrolase n=1 Tax=Runella sp. TaxID=1960881 RepID=UPI003D0992C4
MNRLFIVLLFLLNVSCFAQKKTAVPIIFDTDIAGDYDDVGAMALLHAFADQGEAEILGMVSCNVFHTTVPTISVLNTYFGRPSIPVGITKTEFPNKDCQQKWAQGIVEKYPHALKSNAEAMDAVKLYRQLLAKQPDRSVTIITVGFFTNLAQLLDSKPDEFSKLTGKELIKKKVKNLVSMAAGLPAGKDRFHEYNVHVDAKSSQKVFADWNTPILLSGFEIGEKIHTGIRLISSASIQNSPVKDAYQIALTADKNTKGRMSWDQTAVLVAIRGVEPYFSSRKLNFEITDDGTNILIPGERFEYLTEKMPAAEVAQLIENLMMHQPKTK